MIPDYASVTESAGTLVSAEAMDMVLTRYQFAAPLCEGKAVLEVGCGPGAGLGLIRSLARRLVGGDYTDGLLRQARNRYGSRVPFVRLDASSLPFGRGSFEVVLLFETIYFLPDVEAFLESCRDALTTGGLVIVATVNPEWDAFNPAPFSTKYWTAAALDSLFRAHGFSCELHACFPARDASPRGQLTSAAKRVAVMLRLMPKTMKGKEWLKRLAFGQLHPFPAEVSSETGTYRPPEPVADVRRIPDFKVLYAVARKQER